MSLIKTEIFKNINLDNLKTIKPFSSSINLEISNNNLENIAEILQNLNFFFSLPINLNTSTKNKIDSFQVIIQSATTFKEQFSNKIFSSSLDNQSFTNEISSIDREFVDKELLNFLSQRQENKREETNNISKVFDFNFNSGNVSNLQDQTDLFSFDINFPNDISKDIVTLDKNLSIKLIAFNKEKCILDETEFYDLESYFFYDKFNNQEEVDLEKYYSNYFIDNFVKSARLFYLGERFGGSFVETINRGIRVSIDNQIDYNVFRQIEVTLTYETLSGNSISLNKIFEINENNLVILFNDQVEVSDFSNTICRDLLIQDRKEFDFGISFVFYVDEISPVSGIQNVDDISIETIGASVELKPLSVRSKSIKMTNKSSFIVSIERNFSSVLIGDIISNINLESNIEYNGSLVKVFLESSSDIDDSVLRKLKIEKISCNSNVLDFIFNGQSTQIENRILYYEKSLFDLIEDFNPFYFINTFRETSLSIRLSLNDAFRDISFEKVIDNSSFESLIKETNKFFKDQIEISDVVNNNTLNDLSEKSIQQVNQIEINDLNRLTNLAFKSGYVNQSLQGDINLFLNNTIVKSIVSTKISNTNKSFNIQKYNFGSEIFEINLSESKITFRSDFLKRNLETNDYFLLNNNKKSIFDKKILNFFVDDNSLEKFLTIDLIDNFSFNVTIKFQFLPFPNEVSKLRGIGIDGNYNIDVGSNNITSDEVNLTEVETINFLYSNNPNLNWNKFLFFKKLIFENLNFDNANKYSELFDYMLKNSTNDAEFFVQNFNINKQIIKESLSQDDIETSISDIIFDVPNINITDRVFNFSLNNDNFSVIESPYTIFFKNNFYNSKTDLFEVGEVIIKNKNENKLKFDLSVLLNLGYDFDDVKSFEYSVKTLIFPLISNKDKKLEDRNFINLKKYNYRGEDFVSLDKSYIESDNKKNLFEDFNKSINKNLVSFEESDEDIFLTINTSSELLSLNNIDKNHYREIFVEASSNQFNILYDFILRYNISIKTNDDKHFCLVNSYNLNRENLKDNKVSIVRLDNLNTLSFF